MNRTTLSALIGLLASAASLRAANPIVPSPYTTDPCAFEYHDTLWIFTGHDENNATTGFVQNNWLLFSTTDLVNFKSWGSPLGVGNIPWSRGAAFAGDARHHNGKFYWYLPSIHKSIKVHEGFAIGVAVADHPTGPWKVLPDPLITDNTPNSVDLNIDPALFVDDDGTPWLYWGSWGAARRIKLKPSLTETTGNAETVNAAGFFEAPWVHKFNGNYYFTYASGYPSTINYSMSKTLAGPWVSKGVVNTKIPGSETNHESIVRFGGHWLFLYHTADAPGGGVYRRSVSIDDLYYDTDGSMKQIVRTTTGPKKVDNSPLKNGTYRIKAKHSGLVLQDAGTRIVQLAASASDSQVWNLERSGTGRSYRIRNAATGRHLSFPSTELQSKASTSATAGELVIQNFSVEDGYLLYADSSKDLVGDILDISKDAGKEMIVWIRSGTQNQTFLFEPATTSGLARTESASPFAPIRSASLEDGIRLDHRTDWELRSLSGTLLRRGTSDHIPTADATRGIHLVTTASGTATIFLR